MSKGGQHGGMMLSIILMVTLNVAAPSAQKYSISVQNATFESGSIDLLLVIKITPPPLNVLKIMWYNSAYPHNSSNFYTIEQTKVTRVGDLGEKTSHMISKNDNQYILSLVMGNPTEKENGYYCCQLYIIKHKTPLLAKLEATKLVGLRLVHGESSNFTVGDLETAIQFNITPKETTLYWIKCFHNNNPDPPTHFFTLDRIANTAIGFGELGTRTSHKISITNNHMTFSLFIQRPLGDDTGPYCCQIDAAGISEPITVVVRMVMAASALPYTKVSHASTLSAMTVTIVPSEKQVTGHARLWRTPNIIAAVAVGTILSLVLITSWWYVRRRKMPRLEYRLAEFYHPVVVNCGLHGNRAKESHNLNCYKGRHLAFLKQQPGPRGI